MDADLSDWEPDFDNWEPTYWEEVVFEIELSHEELNNIIIASDKSLTYRGKKVLVYINNPVVFNLESEITYRFHIADCQKLQYMRKIQRYNSRYILTNRKDGLFKINKTQYGQVIEKDIEIELKVCHYCLMTLRYKGYPNKKNEIFNNFNINEYFKSHSSYIEEVPIFSDNSMKTNEYSENHDELSYITTVRPLD